MRNFIPHVFISIGEHGHFFTLRCTQERIIGRGSRVVSYHVQNLSQNADEAFAAAKEYASSRGMILKTPRAELPDNLDEIFKRKRGEVKAARERRKNEKAEREAAFLAAKQEYRKKQEQSILDGVLPFGKHQGKKITDVADYAKWIVSRREEFDPGSILAFAAEVIERDFPQVMASGFNQMHLPYREGARVEVRGVVKRVTGFDGAYGWTRIVTIQAEGGECVVAKGSWYTEEGKTVRILGTIKEKTEYNGQNQTVINRVKELAHV